MFGIESVGYCGIHNVDALDLIQTAKRQTFTQPIDGQ